MKVVYNLSFAYFFYENVGLFICFFCFIRVINWIQIVAMERITRKLILKWNLWQMCSWKSLKISLKRFLSWNLTQKLKSFFLEKGYRHILFESYLEHVLTIPAKKRTFVFQIYRWIFLADKEKVTMIIQHQTAKTQHFHSVL